MNEKRRGEEKDEEEKSVIILLPCVSKVDPELREKVAEGKVLCSGQLFPPLVSREHVEHLVTVSHHCTKRPQTNPTTHKQR